MDDDIDIEEHDVMEDPRIKCIFPDLSCVKIEIPDEEDIVNEQYDEPTDEPQEMLYQYEYSFETTTEDLQENEDFEEENGTYFYNNEIILGSKPPADPDELYQEALHSHPIVYLENWDERLKTSPCFCNSCEILFPTVNALDAHKMISHSYLVAMEMPQRNTARKSTVTSKYCNHCSKTFPDDTSLIKHLYELLPLNNFSQIKEENKEPENFATALVWPKKIKNTTQVISKINPKKLKVVSEEKDFNDEVIKSKLKSKLSRDGKFFAQSSLVPKSTLFQCNVCQIAFLSCFSALQHAKCCEKVLSFVKCAVCKRKIRSKDVKIHELQHNYNDKLKIYTMNKSIYERVLCKCPKCQACFDELGFWAHYQKCKKSEKKSIYCPDCDVNIATSRYKGHRLKHSTKKLSKKDFIIIEFYDQNNMKMISDSRIGEMKAQRLKERIKKYREKKNSSDLQTDNEITLYYCDICGCCQYILNYKGHTDGSCKNITSKKFCQKCGLCFTHKSYESHLILHQKRSFSLKDIKIYSLATGKSIDPPMSEFHQCKKCAKHFICRRSLMLHNCKTEKYITCKICSKKFNIQAYKIHKIFHSVDKLLPELMKKYNSIDNMWNIMYMCASCDLVTLTYDSAVTHSQGHLNYIISDLPKQCLVCDLRIAEKEFLLHEKLHSNNETIERESFKILKYNYEDLFKKEWLMLFKDLPKEHRQQILSKSIYRYTRSVKMQIEISATTDDTKYFCINCNNFVDGTNIKQHIRSKCARNNKLVCSTCHEVFKSLKQFLTHMSSHETSPKRQTIVSFNNDCDKGFNNHLSFIESKSRNSMKDVPLSKLRELLLSDNVKATHKLYKCAKCGTCVTLQGSIRRHRCVPDKAKSLCSICDQYFSVKKVHLHMEAHKKKPSLTKDSFFVVYFNCEEGTAKKISKKEVYAKVSPKKDVVAKISPKKDVVAKISPKKDVVAKISPKKTVIAKIFECKCGLHFTSMKTVEKHLDECSPRLDVSKETCSKCKLVFPTDVLVTHLINHHHKETKIVIEKIQKVNLFKCPNCANLFTNMFYYNGHTVNCEPKSGFHCPDCRLTFSKKCFPKHLCSNKDVTYLNKINVVRKNVSQTTVHRCGQCDITYLQRNSFRYHYFEVNHALKKPPTTCDICGLRFTNCSYQKHVKFHNFLNDNYKIKVIDPITGGYYFLNGKNRKNDGNTDSKKPSPRKRKGDDPEEETAVKKSKTSLTDVGKRLTERMSTRNTINKPSTSKDFDETTEIIVPDEISEHTANITEVSDTDLDKLNDSVTDPMALSTKVKSRIDVKGYSHKLFQCVGCDQNFMKEPSFLYHVRNHRSQDTLENYKCEICDYEFSKHTLPRHKYVHHDHMGLKREDFEIITETSFKEKCILQKIIKLKAQNSSKILDNSVDDTVDVHNDTAESQNGTVESQNDTAESQNDTVESQNDTFESQNDTVESQNDTVESQNDTIEIHVETAKINGDNVEISANDSANNKKELSDVKVSDICDTISEFNDNISENDKLCYFKCSDCNVCFIDQATCLEHTLKHETLDPKTYIQCKICDFQFLIDSLKEHVNLHHNTDFRIESLTIHEYKTLGLGLDPKIDIYQAIDKVQSRLVSTTTDVGII